MRPHKNKKRISKHSEPSIFKKRFRGSSQRYLTSGCLPLCGTRFRPRAGGCSGSAGGTWIARKMKSCLCRDAHRPILHLFRFNSIEEPMKTCKRFHISKSFRVFFSTSVSQATTASRPCLPTLSPRPAMRAKKGNRSTTSL